MPGQNGIEQELAEARAALSRTAAEPEAGQAEPVTAASAKGLISVTLGTDGRVERITVEPKAFKEGSDFIAEHVRLAANAALDQRATVVGTDEPVPDLDAVDKSMAEIQEASLVRLQAMSASITQTMAKLNRAG